MDEADFLLAIGGSTFGSFAPTFNDLRIVDTSSTGLTLRAAINFTNPTKYSATIPYADVNILINDTVVGHARVKDISAKQGNNTNVPVEAFWEPSVGNATAGAAIGREFLSQYISGMLSTFWTWPV